MDIISQYIISLAPAITAVIGIVVAMVVGVKKITRVSSDTEKDVKNLKKELEKSQDENKLLRTQIELLNSNNVNISGELSKINKKLNHVHIVDKKEE